MLTLTGAGYSALLDTLKLIFDINKVDVSLSSKAGEIHVCHNGAGIEFSEEVAKTVLLEDEITISVSIGDGNGTATAWGCDHI